jgi:hypothetical protein
MEIANAPKAFDVIESLETNVKIGDEVVVLGNQQGAMVVKPVVGKVVAIGPNLVEVDAPFVSGNSGSPIIHKETGKAIAIATYALVRRAKGNGGTGVTVETRRFGYRLDSIKTWEPIDWPRFFAQAAQVNKIDTLSSDFVQLMNGHTDMDSFTTVGMKRTIQAVKTRFQNSHSPSSGERQIILQQYLSDLRILNHSDLGGFDNRNSYDYFRRSVAEQIKFREEIANDLVKTVEANKL